MTLILGIESSCDETAAAVVRDGQFILSNVVASQMELHAPYGGVFPEVASRAHVEAIHPVVQQALAEADTTIQQIDAIAVTRGPGLVGSLLVGLNYAKGLALMANKPLLGMHHIEGHIYSLWTMQPFREVVFPVVVLIVSGGHSDLLLMTGHGQYERLGGTVDDAAGEAFDKVGRLLNLPFPGGPNIERVAQTGNPNAFTFPRAKRDESYDFSFSGLKTAVMREVSVPPSVESRTNRLKGDDRRAQLRADVNVADVAASFQAAVADILAEKTARAAQSYHATEIFIAGGVSANQMLRARVRQASDLPVRYPPLNLCTDNAAMIAAAGFYRYESGLRSGLEIEPVPGWPLATNAYEAVGEWM